MSLNLLKRVTSASHKDHTELPVTAIEIVLMDLTCKKLHKLTHVEALSIASCGVFGRRALSIVAMNRASKSQVSGKLPRDSIIYPAKDVIHRYCFSWVKTDGE